MHPALFAALLSLFAIVAMCMALPADNGPWPPPSKYRIRAAGKPAVGLNLKASLAAHEA
ncbi:hypothetical protein DFH06DRAFT_1346539 [Mycena polygramma]|nr:hypothetical protein DFH06DRAFT_1346539 [Mycena polygramma]